MHGPTRKHKFLFVWKWKGTEASIRVAESATTTRKKQPSDFFGFNLLFQPWTLWPSCQKFRSQQRLPWHIYELTLWFKPIVTSWVWHCEQFDLAENQLDVANQKTRKEITIPIEIPEIIPISRPTDATCDRFLFSIYLCITLHVSSFKRSSSGVSHRTYSLQFLELKLRFKWVFNIKTLKLLICFNIQHSFKT
jgi:hypothetical protein